MGEWLWLFTQNMSLAKHSARVSWRFFDQQTQVLSLSEGERVFFGGEVLCLSEGEKAECLEVLSPSEGKRGVFQSNHWKIALQLYWLCYITFIVCYPVLPCQESDIFVANVPPQDPMITVLRLMNSIIFFISTTMIYLQCIDILLSICCLVGILLCVFSDQHSRYLNDTSTLLIFVYSIRILVVAMQVGCTMGQIYQLFMEQSWFSVTMLSCDDDASLTPVYLSS